MTNTAETAISRILDVINNIENLQREPDNWESGNILYAIDLFKAKMFDASIQRAELAALDESKRNPTIYNLNGKVTSCAELRKALKI